MVDANEVFGMMTGKIAKIGVLLTASAAVGLSLSALEVSAAEAEGKGAVLTAEVKAKGAGEDKMMVKGGDKMGKEGEKMGKEGEKMMGKEGEKMMGKEGDKMAKEGDKMMEEEGSLHGLRGLRLTDGTETPALVDSDRYSRSSVGSLGSAVYILTRKDMEQKGVRYVHEALRLIPGLWLDTSGTPGGDVRLRVRGLGSGDVLLLVDGVRVGGSSAALSGMSALTIDRIEVWRGGQSAVWGSGAGAGVVNVVTRAVGQGGEDFLLRAEVGGPRGSGSWGFRAANRHDFFRYAFDFSAEDSKDYDVTFGEEYESSTVREGDQDVILRGHTEDTDEGEDLLKTRAGGFSLGYRGWDGVNADVTIRLTQEERESDGLDLRDDGSVNYGLPWDGTRVNTERDGTFFRGSFGAEGTYGGWEVEATQAATSYERGVDRYDGVLPTSDLLSSETGESDTEEDRYTLRGFKSWQGEAGSLRAVLLAEWGTKELVQGNLQFNELRYSEESWAYGAEVSVEAENRVHMSASARQDRHPVFGNGISSRMSLSYGGAEKDFRFNVSFARDKRFPSLEELYAIYPGVLGNSRLEEETTETYEVGFEYGHDNGWRWAIGYFDSVTENLIDIDWRLGDGVLSPRNHRGEVLVRGYEASVSGSIGPNTMSFSYVNVTQRSGPELALAGYPTRLYKASFAHSGDIGRPFTARLDLSQAVGNRDRLWQGATGSRLGLSPYAEGGVDLGEQIRADVVVELRLAPGVTAYGKFLNVLDEELSTEQGYRDLGRTAALGLALTF